MQRDVSEIGLGTIPTLAGAVNILPRYYNLTNSQATRLLHEAFGNGVNLYDTAVSPEYGDADRKLGLSFKRNRSSVILSSKARAYDRASMQRAIERSLRLMETEYLDLYLIHDLPLPVAQQALDESYGALAALLEAKEAGKIRAIGVGTHRAAVAAIASNHPAVDVVALPYNVLEPGVFLTACEQGFLREKAIFVKVLGGGLLTPHLPLHELLHFAMRQKPLALLVGIGTLEELRTLVGAYISAKGLPSHHEPAAIPFSECNRCQKCRCPFGLDISRVLRLRAYAFLGLRRWAAERFRESKVDVDACGRCRECLETCPRHVDIPSLMVEAADWFRQLAASKDV